MPPYVEFTEENQDIIFQSGIPLNVSACLHNASGKVAKHMAHNLQSEERSSMASPLTSRVWEARQKLEELKQSAAYNGHACPLDLRELSRYELIKLMQIITLANKEDMKKGSAVTKALRAAHEKTKVRSAGCGGGTSSLQLCFWGSNSKQAERTLFLLWCLGSGSNQACSYLMLWFKFPGQGHPCAVRPRIGGCGSHLGVLWPV